MCAVYCRKMRNRKEIMKNVQKRSVIAAIVVCAGAAIMAHGFEAIQLNIILKIAVFIFLAPLIGMVIAFGVTLLVFYICKRAHPHTAEV